MNFFMKILTRALFRLGFLCIVGFVLPQAVSAATTTVCASSCDFTRLEDAFSSGLNPGDAVLVGASYDLSGDNTSLSVPDGVTLDCGASGALLGSSDFYAYAYLYLGSSSTLQNCSVSNVHVGSSGSGAITVRGNTFTGNCAVDLSSTVSSTVQGNEGSFVVQGWNAEQIFVSSNVMHPPIESSFSQNYINFNSATSVTIEDNQLITSATDTDPYYHSYIFVGDSDTIQIKRNLIDQSSIVHSSNSTGIQILGASHADVSENRILMGGLLGPGQTMIGIQVSGGALPTIADIRHNTIKMSDATCNDCAGIAYTNWSTSNPVTVEARYNLIAGSGSSTARQYGFLTYGGTSGLSSIQDWNGFAGLRGSVNSSDISIGAHYVIAQGEAGFEVEDASSANDWNLAPFSAFLDIDGTEDAGAVPGTRGSSFVVNQASAVDYVSVHAHDTTKVMPHLRDYDSVSIANGTYSPIILNRGTLLSSHLTIMGSGAGTVISNGATNGSAIRFNGISDTLVGNLTVTQATTSPAYRFTLRKALYSFGGNDYDQAGMLGVSPNLALIIKGSCNIEGVDVAFDVSDTLDIGTTDWNVALIHFAGARLTAYVPNSVASNGAQLSTVCGGMTVDAFASSVFTAHGANQSYTFVPSVLSGAGITPKSGQPTPSLLVDIQNKAFISLPAYEYAGTHYTESEQFGGPLNGILVLNNPCSASYLEGPASFIPIPNVGTSNWNIALISQSGHHATVLAPNSIADDASDIANCGVTVDAFVQNAFTYHAGSYAYNAAAISGADLTLESGLPNPPYFIPVNYQLGAGGVFFMDSHNNTLTDIFATNNANGLVAIQSSGNRFVNAVISASANMDLVNLGELDNRLDNSSFDRASSTISGNGGLTAYFSVRTHVEDGVGGGIPSVPVTLSANNSATSTYAVTDGSGNTSYSLMPAYRISASDMSSMAGGYNPYRASIVVAAPLFSQTVTSTISSPFQTITVYAAIAPPTPTPMPAQSGGGVAFVPVMPKGANGEPLALVFDHAEPLGNGLANVWVKLNADPSTVRGYALSTREDLLYAPLLAYQPLGVIAVPTTAQQVIVYGKYYSTTGHASELLRLAVNLGVPTMGTQSVPTTPMSPGNVTPAAMCPVSSFARFLKTGDIGEDVRQLQIFLNSKGFAVAAKGGPGSGGKETVTFGAGTRSALSSFQKAHKLPETGIFDEKTRGLVRSLTQKTVACPAHVSFPRDLKLGMKGADVKALQQFLNARGFIVASSGIGSKGKESELFGSSTRNALKAFEKAQKLPETGILSGVTRQRINELNASAAAASSQGTQAFTASIPLRKK